MVVQGATIGLLEYLAQSSNNANFLSDDEKYKFIDDLSILEIINLTSIGISSYNFKNHVASDQGGNAINNISDQNLTFLLITNKSDQNH